MSQLKEDANILQDGSQEGRDTGPYSEGEKVLAYHHKLLYEAKVQKAELKSGSWKYVVHYLGWSKNWDEEVGQDRLMKHTEANLAKQKKLFKDENEQKKSKSKKIKAADDGRVEAEDGKGGSGKRRKSSSTQEEKEGGDLELIAINLHSTLRKKLVEDCRLVTEEGQLLKLPRNPSVDEILNKYLKSKGKKNSSEYEVVMGLKKYFQRALPAMLLYKQERKQFSNLAADGGPPNPAEIYGAEHLLRLFTKLPEMLKYTNIEDAAMRYLLDLLHEFLDFLLQNKKSFFSASYDGPRVNPAGDDATEVPPGAKADRKQ